MSDVKRIPIVLLIVLCATVSGRALALEPPATDAVTAEVARVPQLSHFAEVLLRVIEFGLEVLGDGDDDGGESGGDGGKRQDAGVEVRLGETRGGVAPR